MSGLDETLRVLMERIAARRDAPTDQSYTASLLAAGPARCAKKFGEEAVEAAIAGALGDREALIAEAADTLYHLCVLLMANRVSLEDVAVALNGRAGQSGLAEKAARGGSDKSRRDG